MKSQIPNQIKKVRTDLSKYIWHFARENYDPCYTISNILSENLIKSSVDRDTQCQVTCFTEVPLELIKRQEPILRKNKFPRFSLYGIGFTKNDIFKAGGLPVIYGPRKDMHDLPLSMRWRHVDLNLSKNIDYSWMREWRINGDFCFENIRNTAVVIAPDITELDGVVYEFIEDGDYEDGESVNSCIYKVYWSFVSLNWIEGFIDDTAIEIAIGKNMG